MKPVPHVALYLSAVLCLVLAYRLSAGHGRRIKSLAPFEHSPTPFFSRIQFTESETPISSWSERATTFSCATRSDPPFSAFGFFSPIRWA